MCQNVFKKKKRKYASSPINKFTVSKSNDISTYQYLNIMYVKVSFIGNDFDLRYNNYLLYVFLKLDVLK